MIRSSHQCMQKLMIFLLLFFAGTIVYAEGPSLAKDKWNKIIQKAFPIAFCDDMNKQTPLLQKIYYEINLSNERCKILTRNIASECVHELFDKIPSTYNSDVEASKFYDCGLNKLIKELVNKPNTTIKVGSFSYLVSNSWISNRLNNNEFLDKNPDAEYLFIELSIRNDDNKPRFIPLFKLIDMQGNEYNTSAAQWRAINGFTTNDNLNPKVTKTGVVVFDLIPNDYYILEVFGDANKQQTSLIEIGGKRDVTEKDVGSKTIHQWKDKNGVIHFSDKPK